MTGVVNDTLDADETHASNAEVPHQFFWVLLAEIRTFHHFLVLVSVLESQVVLGQLLSFEWLLKASLAQRTESESLLLNLDQANFAESVTAAQVARYPRLPVEVIIA